MVAGRIAVFSLAVALLLPAPARAADLPVVSTVPAQNRFAPAGTTIAITFDQHPSAVVAPGREPRLIYSLSQRLRVIESMGVDVV